MTRGYARPIESRLRCSDRISGLLRPTLQKILSIGKENWIPRGVVEVTADAYNWAGGTSFMAARKACVYLRVNRPARHIPHALIIYGGEGAITELQVSKTKRT